MVTRDLLVAWLERLKDVYEENKDYLTELDSAIGDADHGINMSRGFTALRDALEKTPPETAAAACKLASTTLIKTVGGASGPLYGTLFMKMIPTLTREEPLPPDVFAKALREGVEGIKKMGKSDAGAKTMLDVWIPALDALDQALARGLSIKEALHFAVQAAEQGMKDTIPMLATKGRASYLGERSIGHQDPGATSSWLMLRTLAGVAV